MVTAIDAGSGILTCGVFGSIMWWPEAELRSCLGSASLRLSSEMGSRSLKSGRLSAREDVSKVLRRYFTPSSAALAQATLERMHSSGDLQGFNADATAEADLVTQSTISEPGASPLGPAAEQGGSSNRGASTGKLCMTVRL